MFCQTLHNFFIFQNKQTQTRTPPRVSSIQKVVSQNVFVSKFNERIKVGAWGSMRRNKKRSLRTTNVGGSHICFFHVSPSGILTLLPQSILLFFARKIRNFSLCDAHAIHRYQSYFFVHQGHICIHSNYPQSGIQGPLFSVGRNNRP